MAVKLEICLKKKNHPEHKYSVTFVSKVGTVIALRLPARFFVTTADLVVSTTFVLNSENVYEIKTARIRAKRVPINSSRIVFGI